MAQASREAVIFDLDGSLCDTSGILHFIEGRDKNFPAFHAAAADCPTRGEAADAARTEHAAGRAVLVVTSREFIWRDETIMWLERHDIGYDGLYMRICGDYRTDTVVKNEIFDRLVDEGFDLVAAWDDKRTVLDMWAERGVSERHLV